MIVLYILAGLLVFIAAVLFSCIRLRITFDGEIKVKLGFWFLSYTVKPANKKPKKQKSTTEKAKSKNQNKPNSIKSMIENNGIVNTVEYIVETAKEFIVRLKDIAEHMHITKLFLVIGVGDEDAAAAAIKCGGVNAVVYPFLGFLACHTNFPKHDITIHPVYDGESYLKFDCKLRLRVIHGVKAALEILKRLIKINLKNKSINANNTNKDGA